MNAAITAKQRAANAAVEYVRSNSVIGLGSGSTAECFLTALADALKSGRLTNVAGVPSSEKTASMAKSLGIGLTTLAKVGRLDVTIDGADEISPHLELIKGGGGALLREKIVAQNSERFVVIADASKKVAKLGLGFPLPVEVATFAHEAQVSFLKSLGCEPKLRVKVDGSEYLTDNGNVIYDCKFASGIDDPATLETTLHSRAGIVEAGLFVGLADVALIADDTHVEVLKC